MQNKTNVWIPYSQQLRNVYQQLQMYFSENLEIPIEKIFIQGFQEFQQKFLLERQSLSEQIQERLKPPYMLINLNTFEHDRSKTNQIWHIEGLKMQQFDKYQLYFQKSYLIMNFKINIFLQSRGEFLEFLMKLLGLFDIPVITIKYQYNFMDKIPNDETIKSQLQDLVFYDTLTILPQSIQDQTEYNYNTKLRELRIEMDQKVEGYVTTKYKWQSLLKEIDLIVNLKERIFPHTELDQYVIDTTQIKIIQNE